MSYEPIRPCAGNCAQQSDDNDCCPRSNLCENRSWASSCNSPPKTKQQSSINLAFAEGLRIYCNFLFVYCFNIELFDQVNGNHPYGNR